MEGSKNQINIVRNNASIDALILTKDEAIPGIASTYGLDLSKIAFIGDEVTDLTVMQIKGIGYVGAPANAQKRVIEKVHELGGYVSPYSFFDGFVDFYENAKNKGISLIVSDKDGVLKEGGDMQWGNRFRKLALNVGQKGMPHVCILTGSSMEQNLDFMREYGLSSELEKNQSIRQNPYMLIAEGGAIHVNVLTRETKNYVKQINPELLSALKGPFSEKVLREIERTVFREFDIEWSEEYGDQRGKVYVPSKESMLTVNVPRQDSAGNDFRKTIESDLFRDRVVEIMTSTAQKLNLNYTVL